jgi:hypothetical protein
MLYLLHAKRVRGLDHGIKSAERISELIARDEFFSVLSDAAGRSWAE